MVTWHKFGNIVELQEKTDVKLHFSASQITI